MRSRKGHENPAGQSVHWAWPSREYVPTRHEVGGMLGTVHRFPAGHGWQAVVLVSSIRVVPAGHRIGADAGSTHR